MGSVLSDITQFSVSIIQIVWILRMSICLDEFWIIVFITQLSDFWVMSYGNWKHILDIFSFQNSIFNGIFVIKPTYLATMFDKRIFFFFFFWWNPATMFDKFSDFFFWNPAATIKVENWVCVNVPNRGLENWGILSVENWVTKIEWWQITNQTGP